MWSTRVIIALCLLCSEVSAQQTSNSDILTSIYGRKFAAFIAADEEYLNPEGMELF